MDATAFADALDVEAGIAGPSGLGEGRAEGPSPGMLSASGSGNVGVGCSALLDVFGRAGRLPDVALKGKAELAPPLLPVRPIDRAARRSAAARAAVFDAGSTVFQDDGFTDRWRT